MSEMSDVIKKPLSTVKRWVMRAGIRWEAEQLEKQRDGEEALRRALQPPKAALVGTPTPANSWGCPPSQRTPGAVPTFQGAEPQHPRPSRAAAGAQARWPRVALAFSGQREESLCWVGVTQHFGLSAPTPEQRQLQPSPGGSAVVAPLCFFQRRRHKAPLLLAAAEMSSALPSLPGISGAATRGGLQAGAAQPPRHSLPAAWHRFPRRAACADNAPRAETPRRTHQAPTQQTPEASGHAPSLAWALL